MLLALAVLAGYVEMLLPVNIGFPGVKLGLANVVILYVLYDRGMKSALLISLIRTFIIAVLFAAPGMLVFSFFGAAVSLAFMNKLKKDGRFSIYGVSAAGGVAHNITQFMMAMLISGGAQAAEYMFMFYLPILSIAGEAAGLINALIADNVYKRLKRG